MPAATGNLHIALFRIHIKIRTVAATEHSLCINIQNFHFWGDVLVFFHNDASYFSNKLLFNLEQAKLEKKYKGLLFVVLPVRYFPLKTHHPVYLYNVDQTTAEWLLLDSDTLLSCAPSTRASSGAWRTSPAIAILAPATTHPPPSALFPMGCQM